MRTLLLFSARREKNQDNRFWLREDQRASFLFFGRSASCEKKNIRILQVRLVHIIVSERVFQEDDLVALLERTKATFPALHFPDAFRHVFVEYIRR